jgi:hypothetical protein
MKPRKLKGRETVVALSCGCRRQTRIAPGLANLTRLWCQVHSCLARVQLPRVRKLRAVRS